MLTPHEPVGSFGTYVMHASDFSWGRPKASLYMPSSSRFILMHLLLAAYDNWCNRLFEKEKQRRPDCRTLHQGMEECLQLPRRWGVEGRLGTARAVYAVSA
jgi:hypothetical protein